MLEEIVRLRDTVRKMSANIMWNNGAKTVAALMPLEPAKHPAVKDIAEVMKWVRWTSCTPRQRQLSSTSHQLQQWLRHQHSWFYIAPAPAAYAAPAPVVEDFSPVASRPATPAVYAVPASRRRFPRESEQVDLFPRVVPPTVALGPFSLMIGASASSPFSSSSREKDIGDETDVDESIAVTKDGYCASAGMLVGAASAFTPAESVVQESASMQDIVYETDVGSLAVTKDGKVNASIASSVVQQISLQKGLERFRSKCPLGTSLLVARALGEATHLGLRYWTMI